MGKQAVDRASKENREEDRLIFQCGPNGGFLLLQGAAHRGDLQRNPRAHGLYSFQADGTFLRGCIWWADWLMTCGLVASSEDLRDHCLLIADRQGHCHPHSQPGVPESETKRTEHSQKPLLHIAHHPLPESHLQPCLGHSSGEVPECLLVEDLELPHGEFQTQRPKDQGAANCGLLLPPFMFVLQGSAQAPHPAGRREAEALVQASEDGGLSPTGKDSMRTLER